MLTDRVDMDVVWDGRRGVYLTALKGVAPFDVRLAPASGAPEALTTDLITVALGAHRGLTQSQLASACNRSAGATRHALRRLAKRGHVILVEPCLFAMDPQAGALWRLK